MKVASALFWIIYMIPISGGIRLPFIIFLTSHTAWLPELACLGQQVSKAMRSRGPRPEHRQYHGACPAKSHKSWGGWRGKGRKHATAEQARCLTVSLSERQHSNQTFRCVYSKLYSLRVPRQPGGRSTACPRGVKSQASSQDV